MPKSKNRRKNGKTARQLKEQQPSQRRRAALSLYKASQDGGRVHLATISVPFIKGQILELSTEWHVLTGECIEDPFLLSGSYGDFAIRSLMRSPIKGMQRLHADDPEQKYEFQIKIDPAFPVGVLYKMREILCHCLPGAEIL